MFEPEPTGDWYDSHPVSPAADPDGYDRWVAGMGDPDAVRDGDSLIRPSERGLPFC